MDKGMFAVRDSIQQLRMGTVSCARTVRHTIFSALLTVLVLLPAQAEIVADSAAPGSQRPTILTTANGIPQVNIQTPSAAGVSRNSYSAFNVEQQGAILNNARTNTSTQIGGMVTGNPWLAQGSARVILNEVNSSSPSQLNGYLEVAGQRAQVVVANPAGINCDGCGFINANRTTLTTGTAILNCGNLEGYRVAQGNINFNGNGMDASTTDYTDIIARSIQVNAGIWANQLNMIAGTNEVSADNASITPVGTTGNAPAYAVDVSQLGGMYAGKIMLIGTEHGVGVRNAGDISSTQYDMVVTADGRLENAGYITSASTAHITLQDAMQNSGAVYAQGDASVVLQGDLTNTGIIQSDENLALVTQGNINNSDVIFAQGNAVLNAAGTLTNSELIAAQGNATLNANNINSTTTSTLAAGVNTTSGVLTLSATQNIQAHGQNQAAGLLSVNSQDIDLSDSQTAANILIVNASNGDLDTSRAAITAATSIDITTSQTLLNDEGLISSPQLLVSAQNITNTRGELSANSNSLQAQNNLDNTDGLIDGSTTHIVVGGTLDNLSAARIYGDDLAISASTLNNIGDAPVVNADGSLDYNGSAPVIAARNSFNLGVGTLNNTEHAELLSLGDINIGATLNASYTATGRASEINNASATIEALGSLAINADFINNTNSHLSLHNELVSEVPRFYYTVNGQTREYLPEEVLRSNQPHENIRLISSLTLAASQDRADYTYRGGCTATATDNDGNTLCTAYERLNSFHASDIYTGIMPHTNFVVEAAIPDQVCDSEGYCSSTSSFTDTVVLIRSPDGTETIYNLTGGGYQDFTQWDYVTTTYQDQIFASEPGEILANGNISLIASQVSNQDSHIIAGGDLVVADTSGTAIPDDVYNESTAGTQRIEQHGTLGRYWFENRSWPSSDVQHTPADTTRAYNQSDTYEIFPEPAIGLRYNTTPLIAELDPSVIRIGGSNITLPNSSLYVINSNPDAHYLIETDPRFTNTQQWLSSSYMLDQFDFDQPYKLLGDGFYEQQFIADQIKDLTGMRSLPGFYDDEVAYLALMNNGVAVGRELHLTPGVALTVEQIGSLASDIVWLVERDVSLPNGSSQKVLVPQVYLRVHEGDIDGSGALMSGSSVNLNINGFMQNSGNVSARTAVTISANDTNNSGGIRGDNVALTTANDINNNGGSVHAGNLLWLDAGNDLSVASTISDSTFNDDSGFISSRTTQVNRVAGLYVSNPNGVLLASAGNNINLTAADIRNDGVMTLFDAANDIGLDTVTESNQLAVNWDDKNYRHQSSSQELGTSIQTSGDIQLNAGNNINARAAQVTSTQGALLVNAANDINLTTGEQTQTLDEASYHASSNMLSSRSSARRDTLSQNQALASTFSAATSSLTAGNDLSISGSNVVADHNIELVAQNNIEITAAQSTQTESHLADEKKSGLMSSGLTVTIGTQQQTSSGDTERTFAVASTVGSTGGNVAINAGNIYNQTGSNVLAMSAVTAEGVGAPSGAQSVEKNATGNITLTAQQVNITEAYNTEQNVDDTHFKQSGLSVGISSPILDAIKTVDSMQEAAEQTSDSRMDTLATFAATMAAYNAYSALNGGPNVDPIALNVSIGHSESNSHSEQSATQVVGSTVKAGGDVSITASTPAVVGAPSGAQNEHNITHDIVVRSSDINGNNISLNAEQNINLLAAQNTAEQHSTNSSTSGSVGVSMSPTSGIRPTASYGRDRGYADGSDVAWTNTHVNADNNLILNAGNNTTLRGAVAEANQITANIGGDLTIESLQDTSTYDNEQRGYNIGASGNNQASFGAEGGAGGSFGIHRQDITSNYASVNEQSGIQAGDGGFNIAVQNHTQLTGAVITSTQAAIDNNVNQLTTGTFGYTDIENHSAYDAQSVSIGANYSTHNNNNGEPVGYHGFGAQAPIAMNAEDSATSITHSGISGASVTLVGAPSGAQDDSVQQLALLDRSVLTGAVNSSHLDNLYNTQTQQQIDAGFAITQTFIQQGNQFIADRASEADRLEAQADAADQQANDPSTNLTDEQRQYLRSQAENLRQQSAQAEIDNQTWQMGGTGRILLTALGSGMSGNVSGSGSQMLQAATVNVLQSYAAQEIKKLAPYLGGEGSAAHMALHGLLACAGANAQGVDCSSAALGAASSVVINGLIAGSSNTELTSEQRDAINNIVGNLVAGITMAVGGDAVIAATAAQIETENNTLYIHGQRVIAYDALDNDRVVILSEDDVRQLAAQVPALLESEIAGIDPDRLPVELNWARLIEMTTSDFYNLSDPNDFQALSGVADMSYSPVDGSARVYFQNGMNTTTPHAQQGAALLGSYFNMPTGWIANDTAGLPGDLGEYLPVSLGLKDILTEYDLRQINAQGPSLIVMHSAGNEDARKALEIGSLHGHQYENLSFISLGSPVSATRLEAAFNQAGAGFIGQVNDWRDPVTYSRTAGTVSVASFLGGLGYGAVQGCGAGASGGWLGCVFGGITGAAAGAVPGVAGFFSMNTYHPFEQYMTRPDTQQLLQQWQLRESWASWSQNNGAR